MRPPRTGLHRAQRLRAPRTRPTRRDRPHHAHRAQRTHVRYTLTSNISHQHKRVRKCHNPRKRPVHAYLHGHGDNAPQLKRPHSVPPPSLRTPPLALVRVKRHGVLRVATNEQHDTHRARAQHCTQQHNPDTAHQRRRHNQRQRHQSVPNNVHHDHARSDFLVTVPNLRNVAVVVVNLTHCHAPFQVCAVVLTRQSLHTRLMLRKLSMFLLVRMGNK